MMPPDRRTDTRHRMIIKKNNTIETSADHCSNITSAIREIPYPASFALPFDLKVRVVNNHESNDDNNHNNNNDNKVRMMKPKPT